MRMTKRMCLLICLMPPIFMKFIEKLNINKKLLIIMLQFLSINSHNNTLCSIKINRKNNYNCNNSSNLHIIWVKVIIIRGVLLVLVVSILVIIGTFRILRRVQLVLI